MYMGLMLLDRHKYIQHRPSGFEVEMVMEKLKRHKSPNIDQISAELIKAEGRMFRCESHKLHYFYLE
jgi:hypothetical protein